MVINQGRYWIQPKTLCMKKNAPFITYGKKFLGVHAVGDTVNIQDLRDAIREGCTHIKSIIKGTAYTISIQDFLIHSHKWTDQENKDVRSCALQHYTKEGKDQNGRK